MRAAGDVDSAPPAQRQKTSVLNSVPAERRAEESHVDLSEHLAERPSALQLLEPLGSEALNWPAANDPHGVPAAGLDAEPTRPSWRAPEPPLPSKSELKAPRVPSFEVSVRPVRTLPPVASSLAPGASVWPAKMAAPGRSVPLTLTLAACVACLAIGVLLGVVLSDSLAPAPVPITEHAPKTQAALPLPALPTSNAQAPVADERSAQPSPAASAEREAVGSSRPTRPRPSHPAPVAPQSVEEESAAPAAAEHLSAAQIQRTVQRYQPNVRHGCWNPQLVGRAPGAPSTARVSVSIVIAPSGQVESATAGADPAGFPGLGPCIVGKVQGWRFPKALLSTRAQLPFSFAVQ